MQLNKFQKAFKETMLRPLSSLNEGNEYLAQHLNEDHIPLPNRLQVYHNNIIGSLCAAICATFPIIENLTGAEFLKTMAREYTFKNPPKNACLHMYGVGFDDFIKSYEPAKSLPYLPDVASLEIALNNAYYAQDDAPISADALAQISPEELGEAVLSLRQSATLLRSSYPLLQIRDFCLHAKEAPDLSKVIDIYLMIYRPHLDVHIITLEKDEYHFLHLLAHQKPLGEALEQASEKFSTFDFTLFLQKHVSLGTFAMITAN